jgi:hypothetical protein
MIQSKNKKRPRVSLMAKSRDMVVATPVRMSPYMFFHGEDLVVSDRPGAGPTSSLRKKSEFPPISPAKQGSKVGATFDAVNDSFTEGTSRNLQVDVVRRNEKVEQLKRNVDTLLHPRNTNIASLYRLLGRKALQFSASKLEGSAGISSSLLSIGMRSVIDVFKDQFEIVSDALLEAFRGGMVLRFGTPLSCEPDQEAPQERGLHRQSSVASFDTKHLTRCGVAQSEDCALPFAAVMEIVDEYINGSHSIRTRLACFQIFDVEGLRVVTLKSLRQLRGAKPDILKKMTGGATQPMLKALLDLFSHSDNITTTLTKDEIVPFFDVSESLVGGFMEEILRQIVECEFGQPREKFL